MTEKYSVPTRRLTFEEGLAAMEKYSAQDQDLVLSHVIVVLSSLFPDGEDFFVDSVRNYRSQITDPDLKKAVNGFIGQESMHGRIHRDLNDRFDELGYPSSRVAKQSKFFLKLFQRIGTKKQQLAVTSALEHFTATLAEDLMALPEARTQFEDETVRNIFIWHALEEAEHKAVAFDVYQAIGGTERTRIVAMKVIRTLFIGFTVFHTSLSLAGDRRSYKKGELRRSLKNFRNQPIADARIWRLLRAYDRRGFHPDQIDATDLIEKWRIDLFGDDGILNDQLVRPGK